jgi:hypothetical protein
MAKGCIKVKFGERVRRKVFRKSSWLQFALTIRRFSGVIFFMIVCYKTTV